MRSSAYEKRKQRGRKKRAADAIRLEMDAKAIEYARKILAVAKLRTPAERARITRDYVTPLLAFLSNKKRGRKAETARDQDVIEVVWTLASAGVRPTRNREQRLFESGCSIAAKVFTERGPSLSEQGAEKIWQRFMKIVRNNSA
jgi:hypothetical protein